MLRVVLSRQRRAWVTILRRSQTTSSAPPTVPQPPAPTNATPPAHPQPPPLPPEPPSSKQTSPQTTPDTPSTPPPPPPPKKRRFRRFLFYTTAFLGLGYAGGIYYALVSDNFHDFFTEYIPFGEDAVLFFEEREFRRRFPDPTTGAREGRSYPQISGENKVTVGRQSGVSAKAAEERVQKALDGSKGKTGGVVPKTTKQEKPKDAKATTPGKRDDSKQKESKVAPKAEEAKSIPPVTAPIPQIDTLAIDNAADPVVQNVSKILNDVITVVNADNASNKYGTTIDKAKDDVKKLASDIAVYRAQDAKAADDKIRQTQFAYDEKEQELKAIQKREQEDQVLSFREEYELERARLAKTYEDKIQAEVAAVQKLADQRRQNELLEQNVKLTDSFAKDVKDRVESERASRLSRLNELASDVEDLEKVTKSYTSMLDSNLQVQHLITAVEAVRAALDDADRPKPFIHELVALKEIAPDDSVVGAAIGSVDPVAYQRGIPTSAQLIDRFRRVAEEVRKASLLPEDAGAASHAASFMLSRLMFKKEGLVAGDDVESVLTRTETLLEEGNLDDATREMNGLTGWARVLSSDWLTECRRTLEVRQALDVIATQARLQSLRIQ